MWSKLSFFAFVLLFLSILSIGKSQYVLVDYKNTSSGYVFTLKATTTNGPHGGNNFLRTKGFIIKKKKIIFLSFSPIGKVLLSLLSSVRFIFTAAKFFR